MAARPAVPERDAYLARWVRHEMVDRLRSDAIRWLPAVERDAFFAEVQRLLRERIPRDVVRGLSSQHRWAAAVALTGTPGEFWRAEDVVAGSTVDGLAERPGSAALAGAVGAETLRAAVAELGDDPPLPTTRPARSSRARRARTARTAVVRAVTGVAGGRYQRQIAAWARTPSRLARDVGRSAAVVAAAAATVLAAVGLAPVLAVVLVAAVRSGDFALGGAVIAGASLIAVGAVTGRRWRRRDIRAFPAARGSVLARAGWIGLAAAACAAAVTAIGALALLGR